MCKSKTLKVAISVIVAFIIVISLAFYIYHRTIPLFKFEYDKSTGNIELISKAGSNDYYKFTTNNVNAFTIVYGIGEYQGHFLIDQSSFLYNLKFNAQYIGEKPMLYFARIKNKKVISVIAYEPNFIKNEFQGYKTYESDTLIQEYKKFANNRELMEKPE